MEQDIAPSAFALANRTTISQAIKAGVRPVEIVDGAMLLLLKKWEAEASAVTRGNILDSYVSAMTLVAVYVEISGASKGLGELFLGFGLYYANVYNAALESMRESVDGAADMDVGSYAFRRQGLEGILSILTTASRQARLSWASRGTTLLLSHQVRDLLRELDRAFA